MEWIGCVRWENSEEISRHELLHYFVPFSTEFRKATKRSRMHPNGMKNATKCQFRVQWGGSGAFVGKNSDTTTWHELLY